MTDSLNVAWVREVFCQRSETFLYEPLKYFKNWKPVVFTRRWENKDVFPYASVLEPTGKYETLRSRITSRLHYGSTLFGQFFVDMCAQHSIRIIHAHFGPTGVSSLDMARKLNLPLITSFYGYDMSGLARQRHWKEAYDRLFDEGDFFVVEGPYMKQGLAELGCSSDKIRIVPIGVDTNRYDFRPRSVDAGEEVTILMAGRIVEKKGMIYGIEAIQQILAESKQVKLRIIGDGPLKGALLEAVSDLGIGGHVAFVNPVEHEEFRRELYNAHIGLVPSVTAANGDSEGGAPKVLLEMQASGMPVIATNHADIPNVVLQNRSGIIIPERDVDGIAEAAIRLLRDRSAWLQMGQEGFDFMRRKFSLEAVTKRYEELYDVAVPR